MPTYTKADQIEALRGAIEFLDKAKMLHDNISTTMLEVIQGMLQLDTMRVLAEVEANKLKIEKLQLYLSPNVNSLDENLRLCGKISSLQSDIDMISVALQDTKKALNQLDLARNNVYTSMRDVIMKTEMIVVNGEV